MSNYYGTTPPIIQLRADDTDGNEQLLLQCDFSNYATVMRPPTYDRIEERYTTLSGIDKSILFGYRLNLNIMAKVTEPQTTDFIEFWENLIAWEHIGDTGTFQWLKAGTPYDYHNPKIYVKPFADGTIDYFEAILADYNLDNVNGLLYLKQADITLKGKQLISEPYNLYQGDTT